VCSETTTPGCELAGADSLQESTCPDRLLLVFGRVVGIIGGLASGYWIAMAK
jgi:hypothetical protein